MARKPFDLAWPLTAQQLENLDSMLEELYHLGAVVADVVDAIPSFWTESSGGTGETLYEKGDLLAGNEDEGLSKLAVGADGKVLVADSTAALGVKWGEGLPAATKGVLLVGQDDGTWVVLAVAADGKVLTTDAASTEGVKWDDPPPSLPTAAKGDLLVGLGDGSFAQLPVGSDGDVLKADAAEASGVKWDAAGAGGGVASVTGTAKQVLVTGTAADPVLGTPQDIDTDSDVQHGSMGLGAAPEAGSALKVAGHTYIVQVAGGSGGAAKTIDWSQGNEQTLTLDAAFCTLTFSNPKAGGRYVLVVTQDGVGGRSVIWPASVLWQGGVTPALTLTAGAIDLFAFYYDGTHFIGAGAATGNGTVTSVGLALPAEFAVSGSPVTGSGILAAAWESQLANTVLAAPDGSAGTPTFRAIAHDDLPIVPVDVTFNAANFTANSATWTVTAVETEAYARAGKLVVFTLRVNTTQSSLSGPTNTLRVAIPDGFTAAKGTRIPCQVCNNNVWGTGMAHVAAGGTTINFYPTMEPLAANWTGTIAIIEANIPFFIQ